MSFPTGLSLYSTLRGGPVLTVLSTYAYCVRLFSLSESVRELTPSIILSSLKLRARFSKTARRVFPSSISGTEEKNSLRGSANSVSSLPSSFPAFSVCSGVCLLFRRERVLFGSPQVCEAHCSASTLIPSVHTWCVRLYFTIYKGLLVQQGIENNSTVWRKTALEI